jgi:hypothetical protein
MDSNHRSRHERAGFCRGRRIARPNGVAKGLFRMRYRWFESISLQRRVSCEPFPRGTDQRRQGRIGSCDPSTGSDLCRQAIPQFEAAGMLGSALSFRTHRVSSGTDGSNPSPNPLRTRFRPARVTGWTRERTPRYGPATGGRNVQGLSRRSAGPRRSSVRLRLVERRIERVEARDSHRWDVVRSQRRVAVARDQVGEVAAGRLRPASPTMRVKIRFQAKGFQFDSRSQSRRF